MSIMKIINKEYFRVPLRLRMLNWFVQSFIYRTPGLNFSFHFASRITHADRLVISKSAKNSLAHKGGCYLECINGIEIGEGTLIGPCVKLISSNHSLDDLSKHEKGKGIRIGRNCWLGANVVILPEVELGDNVIVAAGAIVTRSFESNCVIAGVPAKVIKSEYKSASIEEL